MSEFSRIQYYDLRLEALEKRLDLIIGRTEEIDRLTRVINRKIHNNCLIVGNAGSGKTRLARGFIRQLLLDSEYNNRAFIELAAESFDALNSGNLVPIGKYKEAFESLPKSVVLIDNFGRLVFNKPSLLNYMISLCRPFAEEGTIQFVFSLEPKELKWIEAQQPNFLNFFETIQISNQSREEQLAILKESYTRLSNATDPKIEDSLLNIIISLVERFSSLGNLPAGAVAILDEILAHARSKKSEFVSEEDVYRVVSDKTGVPLTQLQTSDKELLKNMEVELNKKIIGQKAAVAQICSSITRARLGLKSPNRPLGSFLMLGPSGVGKTETAKMVAEKVFGATNRFIRIDMSEFSEAHTVARLVGAPAGYVGFDVGGGLTNAVKEQPYSLILLDEIEKAHPKIFDIFLQILDDGRLTSGQGETVDFTQTIIMATSNIGVSEIVAGFSHNEDIASEGFIRDALLPALSQSFRLEFLNRFDATLVFKPLTEEDLFEVAKLEIKKVEARTARHNITFKIDPEVLRSKIKSLIDPRFGARPIKRFIETTCENLISKKILS